MHCRPSFSRSLFVITLVMCLSATWCSAQTRSDDSMIGDSKNRGTLVELISAREYVVLQTLNESGDVVVHLFHPSMKKSAEAEFRQLANEARNESKKAKLEFDQRTSDRADSIWGVVTEAATSSLFRRGNLRLVRVTGRGADFVVYQVPGQSECWLPIAKIAAVRNHQDN